MRNEEKKFTAEGFAFPIFRGGSAPDYPKKFLLRTSEKVPARIVDQITGEINLLPHQEISGRRGTICLEGTLFEKGTNLGAIWLRRTDRYNCFGSLEKKWYDALYGVTIKPDFVEGRLIQAEDGGFHPGMDPSPGHNFFCFESIKEGILTYSQSLRDFSKERKMYYKQKQFDLRT